MPRASLPGLTELLAVHGSIGNNTQPSGVDCFGSPPSGVVRNRLLSVAVA